MSNTTNSAFLSSVSRPGRYLGQEFNSVTRPWESADVRIALAFPDLYEIGMSHQGLQILYHILNQKDGLLAERCYAPAPDMEQLLREKGLPFTTLEGEHPLAEFDMIGITLAYELCYSNILTMLDLAKIPFYSKDRSDSDPLLIAGGACALNPEPVADFFDAVLLGDGEEAILDMAEVLRGNRDCSRTEKLRLLESVDGMYIPSHFQPRMKGNRIESIERIDGDASKSTVSRRILPDLNDTDFLTHPLVPNAKTVHDRFVIEVARGCTRGCRFCQAGMTYRPVRERTSEQVIELAKKGLANSGFEELALLSLSTGDYSCLDQTLAPLMDSFVSKNISIAMPSMRVGTLTPSVMEQIKRVRKTGFTLAPEAGSERLRQVINKGITEEDLLDTCNDAFRLGWMLIKCYFMIGLPTETDEDIVAMADLVRKVLQAGREGHALAAQGKKRGAMPQVNVSVGTFVPKPHTPFQWQRQIGIEESFQRIHLLQDSMPRKGSNLKYHKPKVSWLEGVFSRGDRRLAPLIVEAWEKGARLDAWTEYFNLDYWLNAGEAIGLDLDDYLRERDLDEILPWSHLSAGVDTEFLKEEWHRALGGVYTPDCRYNDCNQCGVCNFKDIHPIVHNRNGELPPAVSHPKSTESPSDQHFRYIVHYSRRGKICYLGHLEVLQLVFRTLRRADIPVYFSQGFNPSPKVSFGPALPVGTESLAEFFIMDLKQPLSDLKGTAERLNTTLPPGLEIQKLELHNGKMPLKVKVNYRISYGSPIGEQQHSAVAAFLNAPQFLVKRERKNKMQEIDIRPQISSLKIEGDDLLLSVISEPAVPGAKPAEAVKAIFGLTASEVQDIKILKEGWSPL